MNRIMHQTDVEKQPGTPYPGSGLARLVWGQRPFGAGPFLPWPQADSVRHTPFPDPSTHSFSTSLYSYLKRSAQNQDPAPFAQGPQVQEFFEFHDLSLVWSGRDFLTFLEKIRAFEDTPIVYLVPHFNPWETGFLSTEPFVIWRFNSVSLSGDNLTQKQSDIQNIRHHIVAESIELTRYATQVQEVLDLIETGDCYLFNLTHTQKINHSSRFTFNEFFRRSLKSHSDFNIYLHEPQLNLCIHCHSPELFFLKTERQIVTSPIKGTRVLSESSISDLKEKCFSLWNSTKEIAEHILVTDLLRNDINQICTPASVSVFHPCEIKINSGLLQMQSHIYGELRNQINNADIFQALLPPGSVTGSPKKRVCTYIQHRESNARGYYTGILGFHDPRTKVTQSVVLIRSLFQTQNSTYAGSGAGVTAESCATDETHEVKTKWESFMSL